MLDLWQICYISESSRHLSEDEIQTLLKKARKHNAATSITGILIYHAGHFLQVIEGPLNRLDRLYQRISLDPRHQQILKILEAPIEHRYFANWQMAYSKIEEFDLDLRDEIESFLVMESNDTTLYKPEQAQKLLSKMAHLLVANP